MPTLHGNDIMGWRAPNHCVTYMELETFFQKYPLRHYAAGVEIIETHTEPKGAYFLASGQVRQYLISEDGDELTLHVFEPGSFFPMTWVLSGIPNRHYYEAMTAIDIRLAPAAAFNEFLRHAPELSYQFSQRLLHGLNGMLLRVESLSLQNAQKRVISSLLYIARHFGEADGRTVLLSPQFTHENIATFTGLARETVSIEISKLEKRGLLVYRGPSLVIRDTDILSAQLET